MNKAHVKVGQTVKRGETIGTVGNSGLSSGPHVHYEVVKNGKKVNPVNYYFQDLTPDQYEKMIEISTAPIESFDWSTFLFLFSFIWIPLEYALSGKAHNQIVL